MKWEHEYLRMQSAHEEEHYTDLHMLRVTKELQTFIKGGDVSQKHKEDLDKLEAKGDHLKAAHGKSMTKIQKASEKLAAQLKEKQAENDRLERRRREMEESVAMRQSILDTRAAGKAGAGAGSGDVDRLKAVTTRRKLVELAKTQTEEIDFLRKELERLRQRTFPSFAVVAESKGV